MKKKKSSMSDVQRLLNAWVMRLAHHLQDEERVDLSFALKRAHATSFILQELGKGVVEFAYYKADGSFRDAKGTLCKGISEEFDNYQSKGNGSHKDNSNTEGVYTYWDLEANGFRTFKAISVAAVIHSKRRVFIDE